MVDVTPDMTPVGGTEGLVDVSVCCSVVGSVVKGVVTSVVKGVVASVVASNADSIGEAVDGDGCSAPVTARLASNVRGFAELEAMAAVDADVLVWFPDLLAARGFESVADWFAAASSASELSSGAVSGLTVGVAACEEETDSPSAGSCVSVSPDALGLVWAPPVLTTTPGGADRVAG